jgi:hypothetical protein
VITYTKSNNEERERRQTEYKLTTDVKGERLVERMELLGRRVGENLG